MAKTAKLKKPTKPPSQHSRASRRASSPSLNLDKSLTTLKPPSYPPKSNVLAAHAGAGVTKKKSGRILKRKQKQRLEHGREKAEAVIEKFERKVERAGGMRERKKGRNADWDKLNEKIAGEKGKRKIKGMGDVEDDEWEDEYVDGVDNGGDKGKMGAHSEENRVSGGCALDTGGEIDDQIS